MMHPDEAIRLIESLELPIASESIALASALGRISARKLYSLVDQPPFDKSTMDGFAYASSEGALARVGEAFAIVGSVPAGAVPAVTEPAGPLAAGECVRIMTGAAVPAGAVAVHRFEYAAESGGRARVATAEEEVNIVRRGANSRSGQELCPRGPLRPQDIGLLAANGIARLEVVRRPRVCVLSTGNELLAAGEELRPGLIYDSNGPLLVAQAASEGCDASFLGIFPDDENALRDAIASASEDAQLVIVSGGVSAGDFDFVPKVFESLGFTILFRGLAMRPGMPALLCRRGPLFAYGMPGNPISAFVNFELIVKPLLRRFAGLSYEPRYAKVRMASAVSRGSSDRVELLPAEIRDGLAFPLRYTGSTMLDVLARADALLRLEVGQRELPEGAATDARLI